MVERLPAGRHNLTRDQVAADQRRRIFEALAVVMADKGYAETTISDIVRHAKVSRPTFYENFESKQDCFMAGYANLQKRILSTILGERLSGTPMQRFDAMLVKYLDAIVSNPDTSRLYLVEVYAVGPEAMRRRLRMQQEFVDRVSATFKARTKTDVFACQALVATISTLVTQALIEDDVAAVLRLRKPIVRLAERLAPGSMRMPAGA